MQFKPNRLPGGRDGIDVPLSAMNPKYQRCVWRNVDGVPEPVEMALPDAWTEIKVFDVYRDSQIYDVPDQQICNMIALYGVESKTLCSATSTLIPNYKGCWPHISKLQDIRDAKLNDYGMFPRLTVTTPHVQFWPCRFCPKNFVEQLKDSVAIKFRPTTDAGARRTKALRQAVRRSMRYTTSRTTMKGVMDAANRMRESSNAPPGVDSPNFCIPEETFLPFKWGSATALARAMDILLASTLDVDCLIFDFSSWYEQWARAPSEHHLCGQVVDEDGYNFDTQGCFGWADLAHLLSRCNFACLYMIEANLAIEQAKFDVSSLPAEMQTDLSVWTAARLQRGCQANGSLCSHSQMTTASLA
jgi:hypothetical protein